MFPVSGRFLDAITKPHRVVTRVTATPPGGEPITVRVKSLTVSADAGAHIRRRASMECLANAEEWETISENGCLFRVEHGINFGGDDVELVPLFTGEASAATRSIAPDSGRASLRLQDLGGWIARTEFLVPKVIPVGTPRRAAIAVLVTEARPGTNIIYRNFSSGPLPTDLVFEGSRWDAIDKLASDQGVSGYFDGAGDFIIRTAPATTDQPVTTLRQFISVARDRPLDKLYNTVVVSPSSLDRSQTWSPQVAQITDPNHPRHPDRIGVVPYRVASPTATTAAVAGRIAATTLDRVIGTTETLALSSIVNPALEPGDVVRVVTPSINEEPADIVQHYIDSFSMDLVGGSMTLSTRSQTGE